MPKKLKKISANLYPIPQIIFNKLNEIKPHGWFSRFVNEALMDRYIKHFEEKVYKEVIAENNKEIIKLTEQNKELAKKIKNAKK